MIIKGEHLYLRPLEENDANGHYPNWLNNPVICKYNSHGDKVYTKKMALDYIRFVNSSISHKVFAICHNSTKIHIGNISLQQISKKNNSAEFAILFGELDFMGKGLSKKASQLILEYGFKELKLHRIYCGTSQYNIPMQKLAISLGMKQEGIKKDAMYKNGTYIDMIEYAIVK